jgi:hypothetical protein
MIINYNNYFEFMFTMIITINISKVIIIIFMITMVFKVIFN